MPRTVSKSIQRRHAIQKKRKNTIVRREPVSLAEAIEKVLIGGDLMPLSVPERLDYYKKVCASLGLNPLTRPFDYIGFNGKLTLYARKDCTDQLRKIHGVSITSIKRDTSEQGLCMVDVEVKNREGRTDTGMGAVFTTGLKGLELANALMRAETKAKRRATLSICGLGFLDHSELDGIPDYHEVTPGGRLIIEQKPDAAQEVAKQKLAQYAEGKTIESQAEKTESETITMKPVKDGWVLLTGKDGLAVIKSEIAPDEFADLNIKIDPKGIVYMPEANVFKLQDRAERCGVKATFVE